MTMSERLVCFDAREMWLDPEAQWPEKRREDFLLRLDVVKPLSTDTMVWPSVFDVDGDAAPEGYARQDTWEDLGRLETLVRDAGGRLKPCSVIAITVVEEPPGGRVRIDWDSLYPPTAPASHSDSWAFLGYDVSDRWLLSGLLNCGYLPDAEDVPALRRQWAPLLNQHHLFTEFDPAANFKALSDARVAEHAPFSVFGIWLVNSYRGR